MAKSVLLDVCFHFILLIPFNFSGVLPIFHQGKRAIPGFFDNKGPGKLGGHIYICICTPVCGRSETFLCRAVQNKARKVVLHTMRRYTMKCVTAGCGESWDG